jgi:hypothetical protein
MGVKNPKARPGEFYDLETRKFNASTCFRLFLRGNFFPLAPSGGFCDEEKRRNFDSARNSINQRRAQGKLSCDESIPPLEKPKASTEGETEKNF